MAENEPSTTSDDSYIPSIKEAIKHDDVGLTVGSALGTELGDVDGERDGLTDGKELGDRVGKLVGSSVGGTLQGTVDTSATTTNGSYPLGRTMSDVAPIVAAEYERAPEYIGTVRSGPEKNFQFGVMLTLSAAI
jgi:hypothetical protein